MNEKPTFPTQGLESAEFDPTNHSANRTMGEVIAARFSRRGFLQGSLAVSAIAATVGPAALLSAPRAEAQEGGSAFSFPEVTAGVDADHHVAAGYDAQVLIRWGDPVVSGAPEFDPNNQTAAAQAGQAIPVAGQRHRLFDITINTIGDQLGHAGCREMAGGVPPG